MKQQKKQRIAKFHAENCTISSSVHHSKVHFELNGYLQPKMAPVKIPYLVNFFVLTVSSKSILLNAKVAKKK